MATRAARNVDMTMQSYRAAPPIDKGRLIDTTGSSLLSHIIQTHAWRQIGRYACMLCSALLIDDGDEDDVLTVTNKPCTPCMDERMNLHACMHKHDTCRVCTAVCFSVMHPCTHARRTERHRSSLQIVVTNHEPMQPRGRHATRSSISHSPSRHACMELAS